MAGVMETLFGKKKPKNETMDVLMGGPGGTVSTTDLVKARQDYNDYVEQADTGSGDRLSFNEYVTQVWKASNK